MAFELVIVESPTKAKTVSGLLGGKYKVKATIGHIRDLPKSRLGVDLEHDFAPKYLVPQNKRAVVKEIKEAAKDASMIYLATDPDREGEAISWHIFQAADLREDQVRRVAFHEITKEGVEEAMAHPRSIDMEMVNAQQARRILDRLVGYSISPLLWRKVRSHLSAGRVQSVALRMIVEREREILNFVPQEYWSVDARLSKLSANGRKPSKSMAFTAALLSRKGESGNLEIKSQEEAEGIVSQLQGAAFAVADVRKGKNTRNAQPPFTTSTLQQEAYRKLGFTTRHTMAIAQQLYEGIGLGREGSAGLITYMRTDSTRVSENAVRDAREYLRKKYGASYVPKRPNSYTRRAKGAQEAHEAIRPTSIFREPEQVRPFLSNHQFRLYELIWKRMVASQATPAIYDTTAVDIDAIVANSGIVYLLRANDSILAFPGFSAIYSESKDEEEESEKKDGKLPELSPGEGLQLLDLLPKQHFTQPPPRFTDATLVKALEVNGIGRPSTYASILSTLQERGYVQRVRRHLQPMEIGFVVNDILTENFPEVVDVGFTALMEDELDQIASGDEDWVKVLWDFYKPFETSLKEADTNIEKVEITLELTGEDCQLCGQPLVIRNGRFGKFIACSGFPKCRYTSPILNTIGVKCPQCGGELVEKRTKRRRTFYGCASYPACDFASWDRPLKEPCPECGGMLARSASGSTKCLKCEKKFSGEALKQVAVGA